MTLESKLERLRKDSPVVGRVFDAIRTMPRAESVMTVEDIAQKSKVTQKAVRDALAPLLRAKMCTFIIGRHGHQSRYDWEETAFWQVLPGFVKGERVDDGLDMETEPAKLISFKLSRVRNAVLTLPGNATREDLASVYAQLGKLLR